MPRTALTDFQRLETTGVWHESPDAQRRDVVVVLGEASLIIQDHNDMALTHWSLAAIERSGHGTNPAVYTPGEDTGERLDITDSDMIASLDRVRQAMDRARPKRWRVRLWGTAAVLILAAVLSVTWLPNALVRHTAEALPEATRQDLGRRLVIALEPHMGRPCRSTAGLRSLQILRGNLLGPAPWDLHVVEAGQQALALPGGVVVIGGELLTGTDSPELAAGHILAAAERTAFDDPTTWLLTRAGSRATFELLTTGQISDAVLGDVAQALVLGQGFAPMPADRLLVRFQNVGVSSRAYGRAPDTSGQVWQAMIDRDPFPKGSETEILSDANWLRLQSICDAP
ncbi:MAG: hypothetical protein AAGF71_14260 [Pseudomonadota bacterium]